jgi:hypothetical protein
VVGLVFPNLEHRHHLMEQADRARGCDLKWYGLAPDIGATRSLGGVSGFLSLEGKHIAVRASSTTLLHTRGNPTAASLQVTVQRHGGHQGMQPLARLALPLVRGRDGLTDPRWSARTVEDFRLAQEEALAAVTRQPIDVRVNGVVHSGEAVSVGDDWAAFVGLPEEEFDVELTAHAWPIDDLAIVTIEDLDPYIASARASVGPLLKPRRPRLHPNAGRREPETPNRS